MESHDIKNIIPKKEPKIEQKISSLDFSRISSVTSLILA